MTKQKVDMVVYGLLEHNMRGRKLERKPPVYERISVSDFCQKFCFYHSLGIINNIFKLYTTKVIKDNDIKFTEGLQMGEDLIFNLDYIDRIQNIFFTPECYYHYIRSNNSITHRVLWDYFEMAELYVNRAYQFLRKDEKYCLINKKYLSYWHYIELKKALEFAAVSKSVDIRNRLKKMYAICSIVNQLSISTDFKLSVEQRLFLELMKNNWTIVLLCITRLKWGMKKIRNFVCGNAIRGRKKK